MLDATKPRMVHKHLSSDISTNLLVASIAEELTKTIRKISIAKTDKNKILGNLLEINKIVEENKSEQKFQKFRNQLEEIQSILNEPLHKCWMDKVLSRTEDLIIYMKSSEDQRYQSYEDENRSKNERDFIRQCFQEWTENVVNSKETLSVLPKTLNSPLKHSSSCKDVQTNNYEHLNSFGSESEVLIVNYSSIGHKSLDIGSEDNVLAKVKRKRLKDSPKAERKERKYEQSRGKEKEKEQNANVDKGDEKCVREIGAVLKPLNENRRKEKARCTQKTPGTEMKKSKQISQRIVSHPNMEGIGTNIIVLSGGKTKTSKNAKEHEDVMGLKSELHTCILKKFCEAKLPGKPLKKDNDQRKDSTKDKLSRTRLKDTGCTTGDTNGETVRRRREKREEKEIRKMSEEDGKGRVKSREKKDSKRKERKCCQSDTQKYRGSKKLNELGACQSTTAVRLQDKEARDQQSNVPDSDINAITATKDLPFKTEEGLDRLVKKTRSFKKLLFSQQYLDSKAEEVHIKTRDKESTTPGDKSRKRRNQHRSRRDGDALYPKAAEYAELKQRCRLIRRELQSIEDHAGPKSQKHGGTDACTLKPKSQLGSLCTIM